MPGLGEKYSIEIEAISKPRNDYQTEEYRASGLPTAPSIEVNGELAVKGDISQDKLEALICRHLGIEPPDVKKGFLGNIFGG